MSENKLLMLCDRGRREGRVTRMGCGTAKREKQLSAAEVASKVQSNASGHGTEQPRSQVVAGSQSRALPEANIDGIEQASSYLRIIILISAASTFA